jgi:hypothetical protein
VVRELTALNAGVTPAAWMRAHPADSLVIFERALMRLGDDRWCARAMQWTDLASGTRVVRHAYFYPPAPPPDRSLPAAEHRQLIYEQCRLGAIWLETAVADSVSGGALATQTRDALARAYGAVRPMPDVRFRGAAYWRAQGRWASDSAVVASAYDHGVKPLGHRVLAFAFLPFAGLDFARRVGGTQRAADRKASALAARAARLSGIDARRVARLFAASAAAESAYQSVGPRDRSRLRAVETQIVSAFRDWIAATGSLDASRRAAAVLAADQVIGSGAATYLLAQDSAGPARRALTELGAQFTHSELGGGEYYTHSWLRSARQLDSAGRAGQLATLALLRIGLNDLGMCRGTKDASQRVSAMAEQLLLVMTDSAEAAELHFLAGNGYADIVALAAGEGGSYADASAYTAAAPDARSRAIAHYREGVKLDPTPGSRDGLAAWLEAWRLLAGLPPTTTHFFCVYD